MEPFEWSNRVHFIVTYMYDTDNNGYLDVCDFECLALKYTIQEGKGAYDKEIHEKKKQVMISLWNEIAGLADFNKDGQVSVEEFKQAVQNVCVGKAFENFPESLKYAITSKFNTTDINGDGLITVEEYRLEYVSRTAIASVTEIDECFEKLLNDDDRRLGGINLSRYQDLFAEFIGSPESTVPGVYLFGPLPVIE
ncbi:sarcoplasmic calcium-binding protein 1-like [Limulus polyphemus]|uniref:Sarcoplasmic calcium-binding protein 1-like n=1 Tax=Limulus polyphemus TaxID=6850 RepID=A0ABM1BP84_LIMPO|nr:sarcoplasmic calcium-binding protein 1-like [Limulus polyphemus]